MNMKDKHFSVATTRGGVSISYTEHSNITWAFHNICLPWITECMTIANVSCKAHTMEFAHLALCSGHMNDIEIVKVFNLCNTNKLVETNSQESCNAYACTQAHTKLCNASSLSNDLTV